MPIFTYEIILICRETYINSTFQLLLHKFISQSNNLLVNYFRFRRFDKNMKIGEILSDSLRYPFTDIKKFIILLILLLGSILIIPGIFAYGYIIKIIKSSFNGSNVLPDFKGSDDILEDGIKFIGASIIYGIPAFIITLVLILTSIHKFTTINLITNPSGSIILLIVGFIVNIAFFIGLANMAHQDRFAAAFDFKNIFKLIKTIGWKNYLVYLVIYTIIAQLLSLVISSAFNPINILGPSAFVRFGEFFLISILVNTYILAFGSRLRGLIYPIGIVEPYSKDKPDKDKLGPGISNSEIRSRLKAKRNNKTCPKCNTTVDEDMKFCPECGGKIENV